MKSHYAQYIAEREGYEIIEDEKGFATYKIFGEECYIRDIFVEKKFRTEHVASEYADKIAAIAKEKGCKVLTGTVAPKANNSTAGVAVLLAYGFKLHDSNHQGLVFVKEIK